MIKNYLFVYPSSNFRDISIEGINIFEYNGQEKIEDFFFTDEFIVLENKVLTDKFIQAEKYINRHIGTWQRWLSSWQDEIGKYRDLKDIVFKIYNWLKIKNISEIIFWTSAPHHVDTSLIEIAARLNNIKTLFFYYEEIFTGNYLPMYRKEFKFNYKLNKEFQAPVETCELYVRKFLTRVQRGAKANWIPKDLYFKKNFSISILYLLTWHLKKLFSRNFIPYKNLKEINLIEDLIFIIKQNNYLIKLKKEHNINKKKLTSKDNSVVIYAHYQPESTTLSEGGDFSDQIKIVDYLKFSGYTGDLYFKEHSSSFLYLDKIIGPTRVGLWRNNNFFKKLKNKEVKVILDDASLNNKIVITCTGSIALERSINGLKTIICGYPWYGNIPGVVRIENVKWDSKEELNKLTGYSKEIKKESFNYISNLLSFSLSSSNKKDIFKNEFSSMIEYIDNILRDEKGQNNC